MFLLSYIYDTNTFYLVVDNISSVGGYCASISILQGCTILECGKKVLLMLFLECFFVI
jgi:hypothetical protein